MTLVIGFMSCRHEKPGTQVAVKVILDTDIGPDVDDAGAVALLHALADRGEVEILAMNCNTTCEWGAPCLDAFNTYYGRGNIPIGTLKGKGSSGDSPEWSGLTYNRYIAQHFPNDLKNGTQAPNAVAVYRKILASQADTSVTLISIGALTNLRNLLDSPADQLSQLNGMELAKRKVKMLSLMAGTYPKGKKNDPNFSMDSIASVKVIAQWPTAIMFSGTEIGQSIKTGVRLLDIKDDRNPIREAYLQWDAHFFNMWDSTYHGGSIHPHDSYDQTSVLYAVRGCKDYWKAQTDGYNTVQVNGYNEWQEYPDQNHHYLIQYKNPEVMAMIIDSLMVQPPLLANE
jgi:inosine-uridine nucleoside N-ribohydrolase